jgi:hypothetical protein
MLNPKRSVFLAEARHDALRNRLFKPSRVSYGIDALANVGNPCKQTEGLEAIAFDLDYRRVAFLVVVVEYCLVGSP